MQEYARRFTLKRTHSSNCCLCSSVSVRSVHTSLTRSIGQQRASYYYTRLSMYSATWCAIFAQVTSECMHICGPSTLPHSPWWTLRARNMCYLHYVVFFAGSSTIAQINDAIFGWSLFSVYHTPRTEDCNSLMSVWYFFTKCYLLFKVKVHWKEIVGCSESAYHFKTG